ncbi:AraC family ligand binding domain-containing protein [Cohnella silvisoli]|uniref:AraC family ligand binding domain-containing protein n=1 Tax=Cohnella silvisoli TaxID=2873699 RepID=A0ABV1KW08_9BACL|nr:AraC family ligand binding domain-containing protein [Cohnella silvisoli]MCD9023558.1 AraC family ligand binding domain-containing protein [Cohnella silvisoli]
MNISETRVRLSEIVPRIYRADYYPFRPRERIGPRRSFVHSFIYIFDGNGSMTIGNETHDCSREDLFYIPPGVPHFFRPDDENPMIHASIYFDWIESKPRAWDMVFQYGDLPCPLTLRNSVRN